MPIAHGESEASFKKRVLALATKNGWRYHTCGFAQACREAGFPDLVLWHPQRAIWFVELKRDGTYPRSGQRDLHDSLRLAGGHVVVWKPRDWDKIERILTINTEGYE